MTPNTQKRIYLGLISGSLMGVLYCLLGLGVVLDQIRTELSTISLSLQIIAIQTYKNDTANSQ